MSFLSSFYPQPVVAGTTEGTFAEGNDSRIVGALPAATAGTGSVLASGSTTARTLSDRFSDTVNILDYGADPTGSTDSWLAIQRAIKSATFSFNDSTNDASVLTINDTQLVGGVQVPKLFTGQGVRTVYFPKGSYLISRPLVVNHGTQLIGHGASDKAFLLVDDKNDFNAIESFGMYFVREFWEIATEANINLQAPDFFSFLANLRIENLNIRRNPATNYLITRSGTTATATIPNHGYENGDKIYVRGEAPFDFKLYTIASIVDSNTFTFTVPNSGATSTRILVVNIDKIENYTKSWYPFPMNSAFAKVQSGGSSGTNTITLTKDTFLSSGCSIRFSGGNDVYTLLSSTDTKTWTVSPNFSRNIATGEILLIGLPAQNGICVSGGENATIENVYTSFMSGAGIMIYGSSPSTVVAGCMSNQNYAAYWVEGAIGGNFYNPSGDANYIFLKAGKYKPCSSINFIGMKLEDFANFPSRCIFEFQTDATGSQPCLNIIGGTANEGGGETNRAMCEIYASAGIEPAINMFGFFDGNYGGDVIRKYNRRTGAFISKVGRTGPTDRSKFFVYDSIASLGGTFDLSWPDSRITAKLSGDLDVNGMANGGGLIGDSGTSFFTGCTFTRSGTTATLTINNHGLTKGDFVQVINSAGVSPFLSFTSSGSGNPAYYTGTYFVQSRIDANTITITVNDSGPESGVFNARCMKFWYFHHIRNGAHVIQMPNETIPTSDKSMFKLISKAKSHLAGLYVPTADTGYWWTKDRLTIGGTAQTPNAHVLSGSGIPSESAPDGSLYLRTDGDASTTLYVRAGGSWKALSSYEA